MDADGCLMKPCSHIASTRGNFQVHLQRSKPTTLRNMFHTVTVMSRAVVKSRRFVEIALLQSQTCEKHG